MKCFASIIITISAVLCLLGCEALRNPGFVADPPGSDGCSRLVMVFFSLDNGTSSAASLALPLSQWHSQAFTNVSSTDDLTMSDFTSFYAPVAYLDHMKCAPLQFVPRVDVVAANAYTFGAYVGGTFYPFLRWNALSSNLELHMDADCSPLQLSTTLHLPLSECTARLQDADLDYSQSCSDITNTSAIDEAPRSRAYRILNCVNTSANLTTCQNCTDVLSRSSARMIEFRSREQKRVSVFGPQLRGGSNCGQWNCRDCLEQRHCLWCNSLQRCQDSAANEAELNPVIFSNPASCPLQGLMDNRSACILPPTVPQFNMPYCFSANGYATLLGLDSTGSSPLALTGTVFMQGQGTYTVSLARTAHQSPCTLRGMVGCNGAPSSCSFLQVTTSCAPLRSITPINFTNSSAPTSSSPVGIGGLDEEGVQHVYGGDALGTVGVLLLLTSSSGNQVHVVVQASQAMCDTSLTPEVSETAAYAVMGSIAGLIFIAWLMRHFEVLSRCRAAMRRRAEERKLAAKEAKRKRRAAAEGGGVDENDFVAMRSKAALGDGTPKVSDALGMAQEHDVDPLLFLGEKP